MCSPLLSKSLSCVLLSEMDYLPSLVLNFKFYIMFSVLKSSFYSDCYFLVTHCCLTFAVFFSEESSE